MKGKRISMRVHIEGESSRRENEKPLKKLCDRSNRRVTRVDLSEEVALVLQLRNGLFQGDHSHYSSEKGTHINSEQALLPYSLFAVTRDPILKWCEIRINHAFSIHSNSEKLLKLLKLLYNFNRLM